MSSKRIVGMLRLFRPELPLAAGVCVVTGQALALGGLPDLQALVLGFVSVFCISSSALILNDYFDYEVDRINAPSRPLPAGLVSPLQVIGLGTVVTLVGLASALALGYWTLLAAFILWLIGFLYNWRWKQTGLLGNLMVSTSVGATFVFGAFSVQQPWSPVVWVFAFMAFFVDLGEEIAGDAMDMEGDKKRGSRSIALRRGRHYAVRVTVAMWSVVALLSLLPVILGLLDPGYLTVILVTDALLVFFSVELLKSRDPVAGRKAMRGAYLGESLCVVGVLVGQLVF